LGPGVGAARNISKHDHRQQQEREDAGSQATECFPTTGGYQNRTDENASRT
jgi:hypothetical protein